MLTDQVFEILLDGLNFILVLGIAVVIHEAGHFIVARLSGIRVEKFSIGFGKPLASIRRGETEYILAPIPMGGYVKLAGDNPAEITGKQDEFYSISPWRRIPTVIAGPGANIIGAFLILFSLAYLFGTPYDYNIVGSVIPGSLEAKAGLQKNDVLLSVNGIEVRTWDEYLSEIQSLRK
ncbi:MAG: site-2 protease family protein, partial [Candidatus Omnitrophica bacterium]|nr:site-2 protease family protein [Candidatus Omnitrophota bacterium]